MVRAVLFDLFETLITESGTSRAAASSLGRELGCEQEAFCAQWRACRRAVTVGRVAFRQALVDIATGVGSHPEDATLRRICEDRIRAKAAPFQRIEQRVLSMIDDLRSRGMRLGVISNCFAEVVVAWPQCALAPRLDCPMLSFEVGLAKPDREI